jgi:hypothetical protein
VHVHFLIPAGACVVSSVGIVSVLIRTQLALSDTSLGFWERLAKAIQKSDASRLMVLSTLLTLLLTLNICK